MSRNEAEEYGIQLAKFGLLVDIINIPDCEAVILSSAMFVVFLCKLCLMGVKEKIDKEKGTVFPMGMPIICRKMCLSNRTNTLSIRNSNIQLSSFLVKHL
jgi:hypothetical protein